MYCLISAFPEYFKQLSDFANLDNAKMVSVGAFCTTKHQLLQAVGHRFPMHLFSSKFDKNSNFLALFSTRLCSQFNCCGYTPSGWDVWWVVVHVVVTV